MAKHNIVITERDQKILELLKKFGCVREDLLATYLNMGYSDKERMVLTKLGLRLQMWNIITRKKIKIGKTFYWYLAKVGAGLVEANISKNISLLTLDHNDLVTKLAIDILANNPDSELLSELELKQELHGSKAKKKKIPDLVLDETTAIEVEISKKNMGKIINIISAYICSDYREVIYYCNSKAIINSLYKISSKNSKFKFKLFAGSDILSAKDFDPESLSKDDYLRDGTSGRFKSTLEEKMIRLFGEI